MGLLDACRQRFIKPVPEQLHGIGWFMHPP
jgi:hypothetical protein